MAEFETFPQLLNRLAIDHLERKTQAYIQQLEAVAEAAKLIVPKIQESPAAQKLQEALSQLEKVA